MASALRLESRAAEAAACDEQLTARDVISVTGRSRVCFAVHSSSGYFERSSRSVDTVYRMRQMRGRLGRVKLGCDANMSATDGIPR